MKKLIGLGIVAAVIAALVGTGTWALFSDTEESTGNTFSAGVIDLELTQTDKVVRITVDGLKDLKPCETGYLTITLTAPGSNPMHVWKHIVDIEDAERDENGVVDPEEKYYIANSITYSPGKNDIDRYIHFDMEVNGTPVILESVGWLLSDNTNTAETSLFVPSVRDDVDNGVTCYWIYLGILDPNGSSTEYPEAVSEMVIVESFHMDMFVGNWAQSDELTFTEEFYAEQLGGPGKSPDELPGHGRP